MNRIIESVLSQLNIPQFEIGETKRVVGADKELHILHSPFIQQLSRHVVSQLDGGATQETAFTHKISTFAGFSSGVPVLLRIVCRDILRRKTGPKRTGGHVIL